jgi:putative thioredoxin
MTSLPVFDVTTASFQDDVLERSNTQPVLLDFWAEWCAPCRALLPVLEKVALDYGGAFAVGRVDSEAEQELASAFQVQSIPLCVLIVKGRPVDAFNGNLGEAELRKFLAKAGVQPAADREPDDAEAPDSPAGRLARARDAAARGEAAEVRELLEDFPEEDDHYDAAQRLLDGLEVFEAELGPELGAAGNGLLRAREAVLAGRIDEAMDLALESIAADRGFHQGLGRRAMLLLFALLGEDSEACDPYRRRLARLLY